MLFLVDEDVVIAIVEVAEIHMAINDDWASQKVVVIDNLVEIQLG